MNHIFWSGSIPDNRHSLLLGMLQMPVQARPTQIALHGSGRCVAQGMVLKVHEGLTPTPGGSKRFRNHTKYTNAGAVNRGLRVPICIRLRTKFDGRLDHKAKRKLVSQEGAVFKLAFSLNTAPDAASPSQALTVVRSTCELEHTQGHVIPQALAPAFSVFSVFRG